MEEGGVRCAPHACIFGMAAAFPPPVADPQGDGTHQQEVCTCSLIGDTRLFHTCI